MERTRLGDPRSAVVSPDFHHIPASVDALTATLWRERELLDQLLFALTSQRFVLEAQSVRWLPSSTTQVSDVVENLRTHEVLRALVTEELAAELGMPADSTLSKLIAGVAAPVDAILRDLQDALRSSAAEIDALVRGNDDLLLSWIGPGNGQSVTETVS